LSPAAAQDLGTMKKLCVSAASAELQRQGQAQGVGVVTSDAQFGSICTKLLNTQLTGPEPTCPPELAAYVKQLGLKQQPTTKETCLEIWYALTRGGL
jgi:hypothetical protein